MGCESCGEECWFAKEGEPCYGPIQVVDCFDLPHEDYMWVHACSGHDWKGVYTPEAVQAPV